MLLLTAQSPLLRSCRTDQLTYEHLSWVALSNKPILVHKLTTVSTCNNCPSWISRRERINVEMSSRSITTKVMWLSWDSNLLPLDLQSGALSFRKHAHSNILKILPPKNENFQIKKNLTFFIFSAQNIDCEYSLEPPRRGGSNKYHNLCFEQK